MIYRSDIDGLRAIAVMAVVLFHLGVTQLAGGFVGVDVFFVISGFLITLKISEQIQNGSFHFGRFLQGRLRRLMPAAILVLAATTLLAWLLFLPQHLIDYGRSLQAAAFSVSNLFFMDEAGYFAGAAITQPLLHTWSLAVEEQFYLLFPLFLLLFLRRTRRTTVVAVLVLMALSLALSIYGTERKPVYAFYWPITRAWEFGLGALLALRIWPALPAAALARQLLALVGLAMIVVPVFLYDEQTRFPGVNSILPCLGTALVIWTGQQGDTWLARALAWRPMVVIGLLSYSLYLWHWPVVVFADYYLLGDTGPWLIVAMLAGCLLLSAFSWRYVEQPFRRRQWLASDRTMTSTVLAGLAMLFVAGTLFRTQAGMPERFPALAEQLTRWSENHHARFERCDIRNERCTVSETQGSGQYLLWGDSHAQALVDAVSSQGDRFGHAVSYQVKNGCPPVVDMPVGRKRFSQACMDRNQTVMNYIVATPDISHVILAARWGAYVEGPSTSLGPAEKGVRADLFGGNQAGLTAQARGELLQQKLLAQVQALEAAGKQVTLVYPVPETGYHMPSVLARAERFARVINTDSSRLAFQQRQRYVWPALDAVRAETTAQAVYPSARLCDQQRCISQQAGEPLYFDDDHLNQRGEQWVAPVFSQIFE